MHCTIIEAPQRFKESDSVVFVDSTTFVIRTGEVRKKLFFFSAPGIHYEVYDRRGRATLIINQDAMFHSKAELIREYGDQLEQTIEDRIHFTRTAYLEKKKNYMARIKALKKSLKAVRELRRKLNKKDEEQENT